MAKNIFLLHHQNFFLSTPFLLPLLPPQQWSLVQLQHLCMTFPHPYFYRPQRSCGKVMFLHLYVSHSIYRGRGYPLGRHPQADTPRQISPGSNPTWADPPPLSSRWVLQQTVRILLECIFVYICVYRTSHLCVVLHFLIFLRIVLNHIVCIGWNF